MRRLLTAVFLIPIIVLGQDPGSMTALAAVGANAGLDQKAKLRDLVVLNGSASTNPSGVGTLSYNWKFSSKPAGSSAALLYETSVEPGFVVDAAGSYVVDLTVSNGVSTSSASVTVTTINTVPVADAGSNQTVALGAQVFLEGNRSSDADGGLLSYQWSLISQPPDSEARLDQANTVRPALVADRTGSYVAALTVSDGQAKSKPALVTITTRNTPPVANAGLNQAVEVSSQVQLDGSRSTDVDGDALSYQWSLISVPAGSQAALNNAAAVKPSFSADVLGTYVAQLIVRDAKTVSAAATVRISTNGKQAPVANAGANQTGRQGTLAMLNGTGTDPQGMPLTYQWSLIARPDGSQAALSSATIANPSFLIDVDGTYVAQLIVNNGAQSSTPSTVTVSTNANTAPVANAGANQSVAVGASVTLDGNGSSDAENHALSYRWSFLAIPEGSAATLAGANTAAPAFTADAAGVYVAQLIVNDGTRSSNPATTAITVEAAAAAGTAAHASVTNASGKTGSEARIQASPISALVPSKIAIFRPSLYMAVAQDVNGNIAWDQDIDKAAFFGTTGDTMIYGDWDASGTTKVGIFRASAGLFALDINGNGAWDPGVDPFGAFGQNGDVPIVGDWNGDGRSKVGVYRPSTSTFILDYNGNLHFDVATDKTHVYGQVGDKPLVGDWTGDGKTKIGIFRNGFWSLDANNNQTVDAGDLTGTLGETGDIPLLGDWNGDGRMKIGFYRSNAALFAEDYNGNMLWDNGVDRGGVFGSPGSLPVVGDWDGTGVSRIGVFFGLNYWGLDMNGNLVWDAGVKFGGFGDFALDTPVVGKWAPAPSSVTANGGTPQSAPTNTAFATLLTAMVKDVNNNPLNGVKVTFTAPASGASGSFAGGVNTATTNAAGVATAAIFTANGIAGTYTVSAAAGGAPVASFTLTNTSASASAIAAIGGTPQNATINTAFATALLAKVTDAGNNPVSGVLVTFTAPANGASGSFAGGVNTATTNAVGIATSVVFTANATAGTYTVLAAVAGVGTPAGFALLNAAGSPFSIAATTGTPQTKAINTAFSAPLVATVKDAGNNPVGGVVVTFAAPASGASGSFAGGVNTATTNAAGQATSTVFTANGTAGSYTVFASASGAGTAAFALTNAPPGNIALTNASVGQNLETSINLSLSQPAPPGNNPPGLSVTLTSADPSKLVLAGRPGDAGAGSLVITVPENQASIGGIYVQGLASSGTVIVTATASNYVSGTATITLTPSGITLTGPSGVGTAFSANLGSNTILTLASVQLDSNFNVLQGQQVRGGLTVSVPVTSSSTSVGTITASPVTISGGDNTGNTAFHAATVGSTLLSAVAPQGFSVLAQGASMTATVDPATLNPGNATVGKNLENTTQVGFNGTVPPGGLTLTITSNNPSQMLLSASPTAAGSASILLNVPFNAHSSPPFYVQGLANSGTVTYTASMPGFASNNGSVTLAPSGFVIAGPTGLSQSSFSTTTGSVNSTLTVYSAMLDSSLHYAGQMPLAGGTVANLTVTSADPGVGTITTSPVSIAGGSLSGITEFHPVGQGSSTLTVTQPSGFSTPVQSGSVIANVIVPGMAVTDGVSIGYNLAAIGTVTLGAPAPGAGLDVTLTSNSPALLLSNDGVGAGVSVITVHIAGGAFNGTYYLQSTAVSGSPTYTATASGFSPRMGTVTFTPSGAVIAGPFGLNAPFFGANLSGGTTPITVYMAQLDPATNNVAAIQSLAGGRSVTVSLTSSLTSVGTIASPVLISGGPATANGVATPFTPVSQGATTVAVVTPAGGYTAAANNASLTGIVQ